MERGFSTALVADEGGLSPTLSTNEEALAAVVDGIARTGLTPGVDVAIAIDIAANQFWDGTDYRLNLDDLRLTPGAWLDMLRSWCARYPIVSLEDVLTEDDWGGWRTATSVLGESRQILGDQYQPLGSRHTGICRQRRSGQAESGRDAKSGQERLASGEIARVCHGGQGSLRRH